MNHKQNLLVGLAIAGSIAGILYITNMEDKQKRQDKLDVAFRTIPKVHTLDSTYIVRRDSMDRLYQFKRNSLRKINNDYLEKIVGE